MAKKQEVKDHTFCEGQKPCNLNYCDENGCQERDRNLVEEGMVKEATPIKDEFCKIIEAEGHQFLVVKDTEEEEGEPTIDVITLTFSIDGIRVKQSYGYHTTEERDEMYGKVTPELCLKSLTVFKEQFTEKES